MSIVFLVVFKIACFEAIKSVVRNISIAEEVRLSDSLELLYCRFLYFFYHDNLSSSFFGIFSLKTAKSCRCFE